MPSVSDHFTLEEITCRCGCGFANYDVRLLAGLEALRAIIAKPIHVNSWCRCQKHNAEVGGVRHSQHTIGRAADIVVHGVSPEKVAEIAEQIPCFGRGGIGIYSTFTHLDVRGYRARWDER